MQYTKTCLRLITIFAPLLALTACGYNPNTSVPGPAQECMGLQRRILFSEDNNTLNTNNWQIQSQARSLQNEYNQKHCYRILKEAQDNRHKATKTAEQAVNDNGASSQ